jgi:hypothetical protein
MSSMSSRFLEGQKTSRAGGWSALVVLSVLSLAPGVGADPLKPNPYYFPRPDMCTVMMDFQKVRSRLTDLAADARAIELSRGMLAEWSASGAEKCSGASKVTMMAVYIPGVDVYGRPDFGRRTNLMRLVGDAAKLQALGRSANQLTMTELRGVASVEVF